MNKLLKGDTRSKPLAVFLRANALGKCMNPFFIPPQPWLFNRSRRGKTRFTLYKIDIA